MVSSSGADDLIEATRKNPQLDIEALNALRESLHRIRRRPKPRYRLAPLGTHRVTIGVPNPAPTKTRRAKSYPGF